MSAKVANIIMHYHMVENNKQIHKTAYLQFQLYKKTTTGVFLPRKED